MRKTILMLTLCAAACSAAIPALMPMPRTVAEREGKLAIDGKFSATATAYTDARLQSALRRLSVRMFRETGLIPIPGTAQPVLRVECAARGPENPTLGEDESYTLNVSSSGAVLNAPTVTGAQVSVILDAAARKASAASCLRHSM